jgi:hypothetical protein
MTNPEELYNGYGWKVTLEDAPLPDGRHEKAVFVERCDSVFIIC